MANRDTYKYELRNGNKVVYVGITNDLGRREAEHRNEGMEFTNMTKHSSYSTIRKTINTTLSASGCAKTLIRFFRPTRH